MLLSLNPAISVCDTRSQRAQVLDEDEWICFMDNMEQLQHPSELPWPEIMWFSMSKVLALVLKALQGESFKATEWQILAREIRRIIQAAKFCLRDTPN
jgi:hypothetical protein